VIWKYEKDTELLRTYHKRDIEAISDAKLRETVITYSYMLEDDVYGSTPDPLEDTSYFFNHSCNPNCWYQTDDLIVAMRDIKEGEHIVYDYAFTETEGSLHAGLACKCGSAQCRGVLTFSDWRSPEWRAKYQGHVTEYVERRMAESCYIDPRVVLRHKEGGEKGLFAAGDMKRGEVILVFTGKVVGLKELMSVGPRGLELSLQVNDNLWQIPTSAGPETCDFINHSCDANTGMEDSVTVVALRDITKGDEFRIDYGTVNSGVVTMASDNFTCRCGAECCRRNVTSQDWRLAEVQQRYWPFFPPFVKRLILKNYYKPSSKDTPATSIEMLPLPVPNF
jgi:hypothetical protein